jgi:hypothetical protein
MARTQPKVRPKVWLGTNPFAFFAFFCGSIFLASPPVSDDDPARLAPALAAADRYVIDTNILMAVHAATLRLHEIVGSVGLIRDETEGVTLNAFKADWRKLRLVEQAIADASRFVETIAILIGLS